MKIKDSIGFLGCGQAGSNIVDIAETKGFLTGIINTSPEDLASVTYVRNKLKLGNNGGAGKDRKVVKNDLKEFYEDILEFVHKNFILKGIKILYIVCSASGGTGSGMTPTLIKLLKTKFQEYDLTVACIAVLPDKQEVLASQLNSLDFLKELSTLSIPILLPDNQEFIDNMPTGKNASKHMLFKDINEMIISYFETFCSEKEGSKLGNMDSKDKLEILCTPGITTMSHLYFDTNELNSGKTLSDLILNSFENNLFSPVEYNNSIIKKTGFIFEVGNRVSSQIDYTEIFKNIGIPLKNFEGIYPVQNNQKNYVLSILTGLELPKERIDSIKEIVEREKQRVSNIKNDTDLFGDVNSSWLDDFDSKPSNKNESTEIDLNDIFNF